MIADKNRGKELEVSVSEGIRHTHSAYDVVVVAFIFRRVDVDPVGTLRLESGNITGV